MPEGSLTARSIPNHTSVPLTRTLLPLARLKKERQLLFLQRLWLLLKIFAGLPNMVDPGEGKLILGHQSPESLKMLRGDRCFLLNMVENRIDRVDDDPCRPDFPYEVFKLISNLSETRWRRSDSK